ncbi:glycerol-3-phosphate acyltransferase [candidate division WOR-3 bacterium]|nr:glycerol-3-phosphate acyltransferase [candidate division WOR-3 bacterium]MCK4330305.1 glycerol-3-phosphate acyltransferase [candidate division WOR-3 bacterium]
MSKEILFPILAYLLGSISFAHIIAKTKGVSLRETGSGNLGTANVFTNVGKIYGVMVCLCDILKAVIPMFLLKIVGGSDFLIAVTGLSAIIGHDFPIYFKFKGGKGFGTSLGVIGFLSPITLCIAAFSSVITIFFTNYPTLGLLIFLVLTPISFVILRVDFAIFLVVCAVLLLLMAKAIPNFKLFFRGGERKIWV